MFFRREISFLQGPLPPMGCLDYDSTMKFWEQSKQQFVERGWDPSVLIDWMVHILLNSLMADSASRIFLSKKETGPFYLEDLFPISVADPIGRSKVELANTFLISTPWNNNGTAEALHTASETSIDDISEGQTIGVFIKELNLAILEESVHTAHCCRFLGQGSVLLDTYSLFDFAPILQTDGVEWIITEEDGGESVAPVLEPRMAALYTLSLEKYRPHLK